jgi:hypothetical protein
MPDEEYERYVRKLAMDRFPREYLALHGWKAYEGYVQLVLTERSLSVSSIWQAQRYRVPEGQMVSRGPATVPQLWGSGNIHLHPSR